MDVHAKLLQSSSTLWDPTDCSPPGSSVHGDSPGHSTGVGCHALLQGIFLTQGLNRGLPYCRRILYHLSHQGSPRILDWVAYPFLQGIFLTQGLNPLLLHCRRILYHLSHQGSSKCLKEASFSNSYKSTRWTSGSPGNNRYVTYP